MIVTGSGFVIKNQTQLDGMKYMKSINHKDREPASVNELYRNSHVILLTHKIDFNFCLYGCPYSQEVIEISNWGGFIIRDRDHTFRIEIPKYAPFNHT